MGDHPSVGPLRKAVDDYTSDVGVLDGLLAKKSKEDPEVKKQIGKMDALRAEVVRLYKPLKDDFKGCIVGYNLKS